MRVIRAILFELGLFIVVLILGNVVYRLAADFIPGAKMDRSPDAAQGAGIVLGLLAVVIDVIRRLVRRKKPA